MAATNDTNATSIDERLDHITDLSDTLAELIADAAATRRDRDDAIREAHAAGAPRRDLISAAGISGNRLNQVVRGLPRSARP